MGSVPATCLSYHNFELFADGKYHCSRCDRSIRASDYKSGMGGTVDGYRCTVCSVSWACDQEKPCDCEIPVMFTA